MTDLNVVPATAPQSTHNQAPIRDSVLGQIIIEAQAEHYVSPCRETAPIPVTS